MREKKIKYESLKGIYTLNSNPEEQIIIMRDSQVCSYVSYFHYMSDKTGGGDINKDSLKRLYTKENKSKTKVKRVL